MRLVRLERPDEVPAGARHLRDLGRGFLDTVLPEQVEPGGHGVAQSLGRDGLRDRDQGHAGGIAAGPGAGRSDPRQDVRARGTVRLDPGSGLGHRLDRRHLAGAAHFRRRKLGISRSSAS